MGVGGMKGGAKQIRCEYGSRLRVHRELPWHYGEQLAPCVPYTAVSCYG